MRVKDLHAYLQRLVDSGQGELPVKLASYNPIGPRTFEQPVVGFTTASFVVAEGYEDFQEDGYVTPDDELAALQAKFAQGGPNDALYLTVDPGNQSLVAPGSVFDAAKDNAREHRIED